MAGMDSKNGSRRQAELISAFSFLTTAVAAVTLHVAFRVALGVAGILLIVHAQWLKRKLG